MTPDRGTYQVRRFGEGAISTSLGLGALGMNAVLGTPELTPYLAAVTLFEGANTLISGASYALNLRERSKIIDFSGERLLEGMTTGLSVALLGTIAFGFGGSDVLGILHGTASSFETASSAVALAGAYGFIKGLVFSTGIAGMDDIRDSREKRWNV